MTDSTILGIQISSKGETFLARGDFLGHGNLNSIVNHSLALFIR